MREIIIRDADKGGGGVRWPKKPVAAAAVQWAGERAERFASHPLIVTEPWMAQTAEQLAEVERLRAVDQQRLAERKRQREEGCATARKRPRRSSRNNTPR